MHELFRNRLDKQPDSAFFDAYFGRAVLEKLALAPVGFPTWPQEARRTLRALCELFATEVPEADHVVRQDVNTGGHAAAAISGELLMYFGLSMQPPGQRGQFTGVAYRHHHGRVDLCVFVAGTTNENDVQRQALINSEDPQGHFNGRVLTRVDDVLRLRADAASVLARQRKTILQKRSTPGFCPVSMQRAWGQKDRLDEETARRLFSDFWKIRKEGLSADQVARERSLMLENDGYRKAAAIAMIRDHVAVEDAYQLALSLHA